jgi:hypothetical protein
MNKDLPPVKDGQTSGVVTLINWTMMPNGQTYLYLWAPGMAILTDGQIAKSIPNFRSSEKWTLALFNKWGDIVSLIPGCQVKGWVCAPTAPNAPGCFDLSSMS